MANKSLFSKKSVSSVKVALPANTVNEAGGKAYSLSDKAALAQYVMTGTLNGTYYATDSEQLKKTLELANKSDPKFVAKLAVYARQKGLMKDMPAVLASVLACKDTELLAKIFDRVINDPKMLRNFVQILRSGETGRKSFGTRIKRLIQKHLESMTDEQLFKANVGNDPKLQDIIKMVHPKPSNKKRSALYAYLLDKEYVKKDLCQLANNFESFKKDMSLEMPDVPFQMLTALPLTDAHWKEIAKNASWTQIRMNLNTFARHGVFSNPHMVSMLAERLSNQELVHKTKVFPYQLFTAFQNVGLSVPVELTNALQDAADHSLDNVPEFNGKVYVMVDTSGSMSSPATGNRGSVTTKTRCIDVAALFAAAILRKNPSAEVIPFDTKVHSTHKINGRDSIMTNAQKLASFGGGGTNCSSALAYVNTKAGKGDLVIYVSDNESFMDDQHRNATTTMVEWNKFKVRNPNAKLVNIDIQPYATTQVYDRKDILNIGGFSDNCFEVISKFVELGNDKELWVKTIEEVEL